MKKIIKTQAIVLLYYPFKETSIIVKLYTKDLGLQSYIIKGVRKAQKNAQVSIAYFQALNILDILAYHEDEDKLQYLKEVQIQYSYKSLYNNFHKSFIVNFITEFLFKLAPYLYEEGAFIFVRDSLIALDNSKYNHPNFHIQFALKLSAYLGIHISESKQLLPYLRTPNGVSRVMSTIDSLIKEHYTFRFNISKEERNDILDALIAFYQYHFDGFGTLKSVAILRNMGKYGFRYK